MSFLKGFNLDKLGRDLTRGIDSAASSVERSFDEFKNSPLLENFRTGNVVQLISRTSGRALQIVQSPVGPLVVDGLGPEGQSVLNAHWTVFSEGKNIVRLHNQTNFLAIVNGNTVIVPSPGPTINPTAMGAETRFRLSQKEHFILLESVTETGRHIGILSNGQLKSALATGKEHDAHFGVRLIYSPYPPPQVVYHTGPGGATYQTTTTTVVTKKK